MRRPQMDPNHLLETARRIARSGAICDECFGRAFAALSTGLSNADRGRALRITLAMLGEQTDGSGCWVCDGLFETADAWAARAARLVEGIEFTTFLFGLVVPSRVQETERVFSERFGTETGEPLKHAFNRTVGRAFERLISGRSVSFRHPDVRFLIDPARDAIELRIAPLYVYGRYRKLVRGIPQTRWPCRRCRGRGCELCGHTGKQYPESVEELIAAPFLERTAAEGSHLHGAGREDIDARMLGSGRPFVLEILSPKRRSLDLDALRARINETAADKVEVSALEWTDRRRVVQVKETPSSKRYRARVAFADPVDEGRLADALAELVGEIAQRTPRRVSHRRADLVRKRRVISAEGRMEGERRAVIEIHGEGGLYIKELVSGDDGRTAPSLAERLGTAANVSELDVIEITSERFAT